MIFGRLTFSNHPALATPTEAQAVLLQPERREAKIRDGMVHVRSKENEAGFQFHSPKFAALGKSYAVKVCFDATLYTEGAYILNDEAGDRTALKPDRTPYKKDEFICWAECVQRAPQISFSDSETDDYRRRAQFAKAVKSNQCIRFFEPLELYGRKSASMAVEINHGKGEVERIIHSEGKVERHLIADESREDREALKKLRTMEPAGPKASLFARRSSKNSLKNPRETLEAKLAVEAYLKENAE